MEEIKKVYLSPSTQEKNIGIDDYGTEEQRMNEIADILQNILETNGYEVFRNRPEMTVAEIVEDSNSKSPDIHIALHSNAGNKEATGTEIFTNIQGGASDRLANFIYEEIMNIYYDKNAGRGIKYTDSLKEVREVLAPTILIELAFHDNKEDAEWILNNKENIAQAIFRGIEKYFGRGF